MGFALAKIALEYGAEVTLISGPVSLTPPNGVNLIKINSTDQLAKAVQKEFKKTDCLIMAAAPADFKPAKKADSKIKKADQKLDIELTGTIDILKSLSKLKKKQKIVGFALETDNGIVNARAKLKDKNLDMIVLNMPGENKAFDSDNNEVTILRPNKRNIFLENDTKENISSQILDLILDIL